MLFTRNQVKWAAEHDWYRGVAATLLPDRIMILVRAEEGDEKAGLVSKTGAFLGSFRELTKWAGYY